MKLDPFFVSVIIPVYNGEAFLAEAVESIQRQGYHPLEIIIVDDGSTDGTANVVASLQADVRYVHQPNSGPAAARQWSGCWPERSGGRVSASPERAANGLAGGVPWPGKAAKLRSA